MTPRGARWTLVVGLLCCAAGAEAQQGIRTGFWAEAALGAGTVRNGCGRCDDVTATYGGTGYLRAGWSMAPRVHLGLEFFEIGASDFVLGAGSAPVDSENRSIVPIVIWYVWRSGLYLKGGAGLARGAFRVPGVAGSPTTRRTGSALTFAVGYDLPVSSWVALTASLGTNVMAIGDVTVNGTVVDDIIATVYEASFGVALR